MPKWVPNVISNFRLLTAFLIPFCAITGEWLAALILILLGFLSDLADGYLARRFNAETRIGKIIDITADILLDWSIVFGLILTGKVPWWLVAISVPAIALMRLPAFFDPPSFWFKLGSLSSPFYSPPILWMIIGVYGLEALGKEKLCYFIALLALTLIIVIWLKRARMLSDFNKFLKAFFRK
jgi:hypothetical protein